MKKKLSIVNYQLSILLILAAFLSPLTMRADSAAQLAAKINKFSADYGAATRFVARASGDTVTVAGVLSEVTAMLSINIDANVTVQWQAVISNASTFPSGYALISLSGTGRFEVIRGGVAATGDNVRAIVLSGVTLAVSGGTISATTYSAIFSGNESSKVIISGGTVSSAGTTIYGSSSTLTVSGGTVSSTADVAIYVATDDLLTVGGDALVKTTGDKSAAILSLGSVNVQDNAQVSATTGYAIYSRGVNVTTTISGGTVGVTTGTAILADSKNSMITVSGTGQVQATENGGIAIQTPGNVEVKDDAQVNSTTGDAVYATGDNSVVTVNGGIISASTGVSIDAIGDNAKVAVSGGTVITATGSGIYGKSESSLITISGAGQVLAAFNGSFGIITKGNVEVKDNARVSSTTGETIHVIGTTSTVTVSGNAQVQATGDGGTAINTYGSVEVKDNATVSATTGYSIDTEGTSSTVSVSGGTVHSESSNAIFSHGSNSTVLVSGGTVNVSSATNTAIFAFSTVKVSGTGKVSATGDGSWAISTAGNVEVKDNAQISATTGIAIVAQGASSVVTVSGGIVSATTGNAIEADGASSTVAVISGLVFAYGSAVAGSGNVIYMRHNSAGFTGASDTGMVVGWNQAAGRTAYTQDSSNDLVWSPTSATAKWDISGTASGISYKNGTNAGFIPISGVAVTALTAIETVEASGVTVYSQDGDLIVKSDSRIQRVNVYNLSGRILKTVTPESDYTSIPLSSGTSILIVRVVMSDGETIIRKFIKN